MLHALRKKSKETTASVWESNTWNGIAEGIIDGEVEEVRGIISAFYTALNRKNFDDIRTVWLPDENSELVLPGYEKTRGYGPIEKMFRRLVKENKPMGTIVPKIVNIQVHGYVAVVTTLEAVEESPLNKALPKRLAQTSKASKSSAKVITFESIHFCC
jgi:hypothetical protein